MMGSGGMIVMDAHACMVDVARYFVDLLVEESYGKCAPCREGLPLESEDPDAHRHSRVFARDGTDAQARFNARIVDQQVAQRGPRENASTPERADRDRKDLVAE